MIEYKILNFFKDMLSGRLIKAGTILIFGSIAGGCLGYAFQIIVGRLLKPGEYALFSALAAVIALLGSVRSSVGMLLVRNISVYLVRHRPMNLHVQYTSLCFQILAFSPLFFVILYFFSGGVESYLKLPGKEYLLSLQALIMVSFFASANSSMLQALQRFWVLSVAGVLNHALKIIFVLAAILLGFGVIGAMWGLVISSFLLSIFSAFFFKDCLKINRKAFSSFWMFKWQGILPILMANTGFVILTQLDMILVQHYFGPEDAGSYAAASTLGKALLYIVSAIVVGMFPMVSEAQASKSSSNHLLKQALTMALFFAVIGSLVYYLFAENIVSLLYGESYIMGSEILKIYCFAIMPMVMVMLLENFLIAKGQVLYGYLIFIATPFQIILVHFFHDNIFSIVYIMGGIGLILLLAGFIFIRKKIFNLESR